MESSACPVFALNPFARFASYNRMDSLPPLWMLCLSMRPAGNLKMREPLLKFFYALKGRVSAWTQFTPLAYTFFSGKTPQVDMILERA